MYSIQTGPLKKTCSSAGSLAKLGFSVFTGEYVLLICQQSDIAISQTSGVKNHV